MNIIINLAMVIPMNKILDGAKGGNQRVIKDDNLEEGKTSAINNQSPR